MRNIFAAIVTCWALVSGAGVAAQENLVVVELYTSAGCSSCPPADKILTKLTHRDDVLPLALHVDYWDYIGWTDQFASPAFTERQRNYARFAHRRSVYTPQMIIGGVDDVVGSKPMDVADLINAQARAVPPVKLQLVRDGGKMQIIAVMQGKVRGPMVLQLVRYKPVEIVDITRGENAGKRIEYTNIVTEWHEIGKWNGSETWRATAKISGDQQVAVIVQAVGPGRILAAARLR
ncbi:MAG: DUF1223 domain-containing protein [Paracoccaceae bacterium]